LTAETAGGYLAIAVINGDRVKHAAPGVGAVRVYDEGESSSERRAADAAPGRGGLQGAELVELAAEG